MNGQDQIVVKSLYSLQNEYEQLNYAKQLKERLEAFTRDFLPHMKEEEEVGSFPQILCRTSLVFEMTEQRQSTWIFLFHSSVFVTVLICIQDCGVIVQF